MLTLVTAMFTIINISYIYTICGLNLDIVSRLIKFAFSGACTLQHVVFMLYPKHCQKKEHSMNFLKNVSEVQFYQDKARILIQFTYRSIALCHTAYVAGHAMACQELNFIIDKKVLLVKKLE